MGKTFTNLTQEQLCDLMCGGPEPSDEMDGVVFRNYENGDFLVIKKRKKGWGLYVCVNDDCSLVATFNKVENAQLFEKVLTGFILSSKVYKE